MANQYAINYSLSDGTRDIFSGIWKLTRCMKAAGYRTLASSNGATKNTSSLDNQDLWGSGSDPTTDSYVVSSSLYISSAWILMQGPSTLRVSFNTTSLTGTFVRGENVTQTNTSASGEVLGIVTSGSLGYAIIMPRATGSGADSLGWSTTDGVTGSISAAVLKASGSRVDEFVREFVFWKDTNDGTWANYKGTAYYQCVEKVSESAQRFSSLTGSSGCTATVPPGGGGTGNSFPTVAISCKGAGGSAAHQHWFGLGTQNVGKCQLVVANALTSSGVSADGSWTFALGMPAVNAGAYALIGFQRTDNHEEGDVDPYVCCWVDTANVGRTNNSTTGLTAQQGNLMTHWIGVGYQSFKAWRRRGGGTGDTYVGCSHALVWCNSQGSNTYVVAGLINTGIADTAACSLLTTYIREPIMVANLANVANSKIRKGTLRWWFGIASSSNGNDTFDNKQWAQLANQNLAGNTIAIVVGPWDGLTAPTNA